MLADGTVFDVANVIWCTGFRPDYGWIELPTTHLARFESQLIGQRHTLINPAPAGSRDLASAARPTRPTGGDARIDAVPYRAVSDWLDEAWRSSAWTPPSPPT